MQWAFYCKIYCLLRPSVILFLVCIQWGIKTVFQEDYFALLNATEIGQRNSYLPARTEQNLKLFSAYSSNAITEVSYVTNEVDSTGVVIVCSMTCVGGEPIQLGGKC